MTPELVEVDARELRDDLVELYRIDGIHDFGRLFDWYYADSGVSRPRTWVLRIPRNGAVIGTSSIVFRELCYHGRTVVAGVGGNLLVHPDHRSAFAAIQLIRAQRYALDEGSCDIIMGLPLPLAAKIMAGLKFKTIGLLERHTHIIDALPRLRLRVGPAASVIAPPVNAYFRGVRAVRGWRGDVFVEESRPEEMGGLPFERWAARKNTLGQMPSPKFMQWWIDQPGIQRRILVVRDASGVVGMVSIDEERLSGASVTGCFTDPDRLQPAAAIMAALRFVVGDYATLSVSTFSGSLLSRRLRGMGFLARGAGLGLADEVMGLWRKDHPLADVFADSRKWEFFRGLNDV